MAGAFPKTETSGEIDDAFLTCGFCSEPYRDPKLLPCLHTFCAECLAEIAENAGNLTCPLCQRGHEVPDEGVSGLASNDFIGGLVASSRYQPTGHSSAPQRCETCNSGDVTRVCSECSLGLCEFCVRVHARIPLTRSHRLMPPDEYNRAKTENLSLAQPPLYCTKHQVSEIKLYCQTCQISVCPECALIDHQGHTNRYLKEVADEFCKDLSDMMNELKFKQEEAAETQKRLQELTAVLRKNIKSENTKLMERAEFVSGMIRKSAQNVRAAMKKAYHKKKASLDTCFKELECMTSDIQGVREFSEKIMRHGSSAQLMSAKMGMTSQIGELLKTDIREISEDDGFIKFRPAADVLKDSCIGELVTRKPIGYQLEFVPEYVTVRKSALVTLKAKGNMMSSAGKVSALVKKPDGTEEAVSPKVTDEEIGIQSLEFFPVMAGNHQAFISVDGDPIEESPILIPVVSEKGLLFDFGGRGTAEGLLNEPYGVTQLPDGSVLVCDSANHRLQRFTLTGKFQGLLQLPALEKPAKPMYVASDEENIYITDIGNNHVIVCDENGQVVKTIGKGDLKSPVGIAVSPTNSRVYVVDSDHFCVRIYDRDGKLLSSFGNKKTFGKKPSCISISGEGTVFVSCRHHAAVKVFSSDGRFLHDFGKFDDAEDLHVDSHNHVYVCDYKNGRVNKFTAEGKSSYRLIGTFDGFENPTGVHVTKDEPYGKVIVVDYMDARIKVFAQQDKVEGQV